MISLSRLSTEAEEIAPKAEWYARLAKNDLPADLDDLNKALHVSTSNLKSLADIRISIQTTFIICEMRKGFELLYRNLDADSRRKNGCDDNSSHDSDCQIVEPPQKKRYITDFFESDAKRKKQGNESKHEESDESVYSACTLPFPLLRKEIENKHDESDESVCTAPLQEVSFTRSKQKKDEPKL